MTSQGTTTSKRRQTIFVNRDKPSSKDMTEYWKMQIAKKEKEVDEHIDESKQPPVFWKYIKKPNQSRLSEIPSGVLEARSSKKEESQSSKFQPYSFMERQIEKTVLGDYLFIKYITENSKDVCYLVPNLDLAIESIQLFYDIQKSGIEFTPESLRDWGKMSDVLNSHPYLHEKYLKTFEWIDDNFETILRILKPTSKGPRLQPSVNIYDKLIYGLIEYLLTKQRIIIDTTNTEPDTFTSKKKLNTLSFESRLNQCIESKKRYIIFFIQLKLVDGRHANMMIIDTQKRTAERFEPQGIEHDFYDQPVLDDRLAKYFSKMGYKYIGPQYFCPKGVQDIIEGETMDEYQFSGFCKTWSFLYALFRLRFEEVEPKVLSIYMNDFVRNLAVEYFKKEHQKKISKEDLKDYDFVIEFLYDYIPRIIENGKKDIENINKKLGTNLVLEGRTIHSKI